MNVKNGIMKFMEMIMNDLTNFTPTNTFVFSDKKTTREVFKIDIHGSYVPEGVSIDEAAAGVIDALDMYIKNLVDPYKEQRKEMLKALESVVDYYASQGTGRVFNLGYGNDNILEQNLLSVITKARGEMK